MVQVQLPNRVNRTLIVCLLLTGVAAFIVVVIGIALVHLQTENKQLNEFLKVGKNTHEDFENSLVMYTEKTRDTIGYLLDLRPANDEEVINFISQVEKIGQDLSLNLQLSALGELKQKSKKAKTNDETISYKISFFGSESDLNKFLERIEALPYYVRIETVNFRDLTNVQKTEYTEPNINITLKLYIKK